jgi:GTP cyclohydrolase I
MILRGNNMNEIMNMINDDLSFEELAEITRTALAKVYSKLIEEGLYNPIAIVKSLGSEEYEVEMIFVDGNYCNTGEHYLRTFCL